MKLKLEQGQRGQRSAEHARHVLDEVNELLTEVKAFNVKISTVQMLLELISGGEQWIKSEIEKSIPKINGFSVDANTLKLPSFDRVRELCNSLTTQQISSSAASVLRIVDGKADIDLKAVEELNESSSEFITTKEEIAAYKALEESVNNMNRARNVWPVTTDVFSEVDGKFVLNNHRLIQIKRNYQP